MTMRDRTAQLEKLILQAKRHLDNDLNCDAIVEEINALSGGDYSAQDFFELSGWTSARDMAERAALGPAPRFEFMDRTQILECIAIIDRAEEPEATYNLDILQINFPYSEPSDLIFHPHVELSDDQVVDEILLRHQLYNAGGEAAVLTRLRYLAMAVMANPDRKPWAERWAVSFLSGDNKPA